MAVIPLFLFQEKGQKKMKKNVFTKSIQFLIVTLIVLAVFLPKEYAQTGMAIAVALWLVFIFFIWYANNHDQIKRKLASFIAKPKREKQLSVDAATKEKPMSSTESKNVGVILTDAEAESVIRHLSLRISDKLKSAYPKAVWHWNAKPSLQDLLNGKTIRIVVENMDAYTHADITFDRFERIHVEPMSIGSFVPCEPDSEDVNEEPVPEPAVVDVKAWYELMGQRILETQITELNANGHNMLLIKENGDIVINRNKKERYVASLESFPAKNYWDELVSVLEENELTAKITGDSLRVSWN